MNMFNILRSEIQVAKWEFTCSVRHFNIWYVKLKYTSWTNVEAFSILIYLMAMVCHSTSCYWQLKIRMLCF